MNILRWLASFPSAMCISWLAWMGIRSIFHQSYYGGGFIRTIAGLSPTVFSTAVPVVVFTVVGALVSPSTSRMVVFIFCGLAPLFSGSVMDLMASSFGEHGGFALASLTGIAIGCIFSLLFGLKMQSFRSKEPIQVPETTRGK